MSSPGCHLSTAEKILSCMGIHWQLSAYLVLRTVLPQEIKPITPVRHQVLYERSLFICSSGQPVHLQDCSAYMKQIMAFRRLFLHHQALQMLLPGSQGTCAAQVPSSLTASPWCLAHGRSGGISCSNQNRRSAYSGVCVSYRQLHPLIPWHSQLGINKNLWFCFQKTQTVPWLASTPYTV